MAPRNSTQIITNKIVTLILAKKVVHYSDIEEYTGKSRNTILKYLNIVEERVNKLGIKLVRKRNKGIYFEGDVSQLLKNEEFGNVKKYDGDLLFYLLKRKEPILLDDLADKFYIGRSTLVRRLENYRQTLGLKIQSSRKGIWIDVNSEEVKEFIVKLVVNDMQKTVVEENGRLVLTYELADEIQKYIDMEIFANVQEIIDDLIDENNLKVRQHDLDALIARTTLAIQLAQDDKEVPTVAGSQNLAKQYVTQIEQQYQVRLSANDYAYIEKVFQVIMDYQIDSPKVKNADTDAQLEQTLRDVIDSYDETLIKNLKLHMKPLFNKKQFQIAIDNPYKEKIKGEYPIAMDKAIRLSNELTKQYDVQFNEDEVCYLALHFEAYLRRKKRVEASDDKLRAWIVCSTGYGSAVLLKEQIEDLYSSQIKVLQTFSLEELVNTKDLNVDLIISTVPIKAKGVTVVRVPPLLSNDNKMLLDKIISSRKSDMYRDNVFLKLIRKNAIIISNHESMDQHDALKEIVAKLADEGYVKPEILASSLEREELSSTSIDNFAIPHGDIKNVNVPVIGVLINKNGITWKENRVKVVFFIAINEQFDGEMAKMYRYFYKMLKDPRKIDELAYSQTAEDFIEKIQDMYK